MPTAQDARREPTEPRCVFCRRRPVDPAWRPFCGERCKTQDLANWADQTYHIPAEPQVPPDQGDADGSRDPESF